MQTLIPLLRKYWVPLLLVGGMLTALSYSVDEARWVRDSSGIVTSLSLSFLVGWALAHSRFRGWFVLLNSLCLGGVVSVQVVGHIVPSLPTTFTMNFFQWVNELNLRLVTLSLRVGGWVDTLRAGGDIQDTGLFVFLVVFVLWNASAWFLWCLIRKRRVVLGVLPLAFLLAVNVHLSRQSLSAYGLFLMFTILLLARTSYVTRREDWDARQVDYSDQLSLEWSGSAALLAVAIFVLARLAPLAVTPEGWQLVSNWVQSTHQQTSHTAERLFSGVNTPPPPPAAQATPQVYVSIPNLSEIGAPIPQGSETVMWVSVSDPPPIPANYTGQVTKPVQRLHYWRNSIYAEYTGRGWLPVAEQSQSISQPAALPDQAPPGRYFLRQDYVIVANHSNSLFAVNQPFQTSSGVSIHPTALDDSRLVAGNSSKYSVISTASDVTANQLAQAPQDYSPAIRSLYLQLPDQLPARVRILAERVAGGASDPYHKAVLIQDYLRKDYTYSLYAPPPPANRDIVDYFLFDLPRGFCSHYASAMVVMLRSLGIPARVAAGYAAGEYDTSQQAYRVPVSASHAWVEVYFSGLGWVEFEPTAAQTPIDYPEIQEVTRAPSALPALPPETPRTASWLSLILLGIIAFGFLLLPFWLLRLFSLGGGEASQQVNTLYKQMRRALDWAGLRAVASVTPDEFLRLNKDQLAGYGDLQHALRQATALYQQSIFSAHPPDTRRVREVGALWRHSVRDWLILWLRERWHHLR